MLAVVIGKLPWPWAARQLRSDSEHQNPQNHRVVCFFFPLFFWGGVLFGNQAPGYCQPNASLLVFGPDLFVLLRGLQCRGATVGWPLPVPI